MAGWSGRSGTLDTQTCQRQGCGVSRSPSRNICGKGWDDGTGKRWEITSVPWWHRYQVAASSCGRSVQPRGKKTCKPWRDGTGKRRGDTSAQWHGIQVAGAAAGRSVRQRRDEDWWADEFVPQGFRLFDQHNIQDMTPEQRLDATHGSFGAQRREYKLGPAFANYRRAIYRKLTDMRLKKVVFHGWRHGHRDRMSIAELVWTEEDMDHFLTTVASYESHKKSWLAKREERKHWKHPDHLKAMSRLIPPSFVRLYQLALAQTHSKKFMEHFGAAKVADILNIPIQVMAEESGFDPSSAVATDFQVSLFEEDTTLALDEITASLDAAEVASYVEQARAYKGNGLFMFVLERATEHVAHRTPSGQTPSPFRARLLYEHIIGTAFHSLQREKQEADERDRLNAKYQNTFPSGTKPSAEETETHINGNRLEKTGNKALDAAVAELRPDQREPSAMIHLADLIIGSVPSLEATPAMFSAVSRAYQWLVDFARGNDHRVKTCCDWIGLEMPGAGFAIRSCSTFGSHCYSLELATSNLDVVVTLAPWANKANFLKRFRELAAASPDFTAGREYRRERNDSHHTEFLGLPVDVKPIKEMRKSDDQCRSTDLLKFALDRRSSDESFAPKLAAIHIFKLICHHLQITQHQWQARAGDFKAITLSYWAVAVCDIMPRNVTVVEAIHYLCLVFVRFNWAEWKVAVSAAGTIDFRKKDAKTCCEITIEDGIGNAAANVDWKRLSTSNRTLNASMDHLGYIIEQALEDQEIEARHRQERGTRHRQESEAQPDGFTLGPAAALAFDTRICKEVDNSIMEAIKAGWPTWNTPGRGGEEPGRCEYKFESDALEEGARIDFYRGLPSDDWMNAKWAKLFEELPQYRAHLKGKQNPQTEKGKGNAMERVAGISYACFTGHRHLPTGHTLTFPGTEHGAESFARWAEVWPQLQGLDMKATIAPPPGLSPQQTPPELLPRSNPPAPPPRPKPSSSPQMAVSAVSGLEAGTLQYGNYQGHVIAPTDPCGDAALLPLVILVPPTGGFEFKTREAMGQLNLPLNCPMPCWYAYMNVPGNHKEKVPPEFILFIEELHHKCSSSHQKNFKNLIIAWGLSRGALWLEEIVREHSKYFDVAFIIAGYPENRCRHKNSCAAKELIEVAKVTGKVVCMVHFVSDELCNAGRYPEWHAGFETAMAMRDRVPNFMSLSVPGSHDDAKPFWYSWDFPACFPESKWVECWLELWTGLMEKQAAAVAAVSAKSSVSVGPARRGSAHVSALTRQG